MSNDRPLSVRGDCAQTGPEHEQMLIGREEAARVLALSVRSLGALTRCNAVPSVRIGRLVRYVPRELRAWIAAGCPTIPGAADRIRKAARP